jgi:hypothetical protein
MKDSTLEPINEAQKWGNLSSISGKSPYKNTFVDKEKNCIVLYQSDV